MPTSMNPKHIKPITGSFANLHEEIKSLTSKQNVRDTDVTNLQNQVASVNYDINRIDNTVQSVEAEITVIKDEIDNIAINVETVQEVVDARGGRNSLDERLDSIETLSIFRENLKLSTVRDYGYDANGNVSFEEISGDINYRIDYIYNDNGDIIGENHSHNGEIVGSKIYQYHPTLGHIVRVISDKADHVELVYNDSTTTDLNNRLQFIEEVGIANEIDKIYSSILAGPYDGRRLTEAVDSFNARLQNLENLAPDRINEIIDIPALLQRIEALEKAVSSNKRTDLFIVANDTQYVLSGVTSAERLKITVEGLTLNHGSIYDFVLGEDGRTITFLVELLAGMEIICEYY